MGDSAYKAILAGLSVHHDSLEKWLQFWTWWVIAGVVCELVFIGWDHLSEYREWWEAQTAGTNPFPSRPSRLKLFFELASVALVVFGIIGELRVDAKLGDLDTSIQKTNEDRATHLQQEADSAETAAGKSQHSADAVGVEANAIGKQEVLLSSKLRADETAEAALQKALLPRGLDPAKLVAGLSPFVLWKVKIETVGDAESIHTANLIATSLNAAHWPVSGVNTEIGVDFPDGIQVKEHCVWNPTRRFLITACDLAGARLTAALSVAGLPDVSFAGTDKTLADNSFDIIIGLRKVPGETVPNVSKQSQ